MKKQFKYPKHFEEQKKIPKITQKRIKLAEVSLGDFEGRLENELLKISVLTDKGADIFELVHKKSDTDFMWRTPWSVRNPSKYVYFVYKRVYTY